MKWTIYLLFLCLFSSCYINRNYVNPIDKGELGTWTIEKGEVVLVDSLRYNDLANNYWELIQSMVPLEILDSYAVSLKLFTDGPDNYMAAMSSLNDSNTRWEVYIDTVDLKFRTEDSLYILDYSHTVIHEFGHLLTLNGSQIETTMDLIQDDSIGYLTSVGYARPNSYLGKFVTEFWPPEILYEWDFIVSIRNEIKKSRKLYWFYLVDEDSYVTPYSAESPEEDIAESWTFFVLDDKPTKEGKRYDKVRFFYQFEELIAYRAEIRSKLKFIPVDYLENYNPDGPNQDQK